PGVPAARAAPGRAARQLDLRRLERQLPAAEPDRSQRRAPAHGDGVRPGLGDHEPAPCRDAPGGEGRRRADGQRRALRRVDRAKRGRPLGRDCGASRRTGRSEGDGGGVSGDARVVFLPSGRRGAVSRGTTVLDAARRLGVDLDSTCGGRGICGRCQVSVAGGEHAKHGITCTSEALTRETETERLYAADRGLAAGRRLGCIALVADDVVIDVPPESQVYRQVVRKDADARAVAVDPVVRLYTVQVEEPQLGATRSDAARVLDALGREWDLHDLQIDLHVLQNLQKALRTGAEAGRTRGTASLEPWHVTAAVHDGSVVTAVWPGFHDAAYGIAFDVGSTTV